MRLDRIEPRFRRMTPHVLAAMLTASLRSDALLAAALVFVCPAIVAFIRFASRRRPHANAWYGSTAGRPPNGRGWWTSPQPRWTNLDLLPLPAGTVSAKPLLSGWERAAMPMLNASLPSGMHLCPQVRLADMLVVDDRNAAQRRVTQNRLGSKSVDFAVIDRAGRVALVIELDDATHDQPARRARDRLVRDALAQAGIRLARFRPGQRLDIAGLLETAQ